jgi:hypothetical protein
MKLINYLAKRQEHKELRLQLKEVKDDIDINVQVYSQSLEKEIRQSCIKSHTELKEKRLSLEKELREIFKNQIDPPVKSGPDLNSGRGGPDD